MRIKFICNLDLKCGVVFEIEKTKLLDDFLITMIKQIRYPDYRLWTNRGKRQFQFTCENQN